MSTMAQEVSNSSPQVVHDTHLGVNANNISRDFLTFGNFSNMGNKQNAEKW